MIAMTMAATRRASDSDDDDNNDCDGAAGDGVRRR
jgi:hypothetical protein